jgi:glycosyltransferase involved in cell wall biosynthesis
VTRVSIIIPAFNEELLLPATMRALQDDIAALNLSAELIVVDDGSTDRTAEIARGMGARVVPVTLRHIAGARNAGGRVANGELLVFVDADTIVPVAVLRDAVKAYEAGVVGGGAGLRQDANDPRWSAIVIAIVIATMRMTKWAAGCFVFVRKDVFDRVGGFDERYFAGEEIFFSRAVKKHGRFVMLPGAVITSGRKARMFSARAAFLQGLAMLWPGSLKRRDRLAFWYDGRREKTRE